MPKRWLFLILIYHVSFAYWSQGALWQQDTVWVNSGWVSSDIGWWEDIRDVCPWGSDAAASAIQVYASEGGSHPAIIRTQFNAEMQVLFPFEEDVERPIQIEAISSDPSNRLWCAMNQQSHDSMLTALGGIWVLDSNGQPDVSIGEDSLPGWIPITFGSPFQELMGLDAVFEGNWMVSGMVLDPCCFHREMPTLALIDDEGQWVNSFGENGRLILDVGTADILDTLGMRPAVNRHEIGGFYQTVAAFDGGWFAGGAYSNATHYEILVTKHSSNGTLDSTFGESGIVHLNLNPGVNHWANDLYLDANGMLLVHVVSHDAGDLPSGWHTLTLDEVGEPLLWETIESDSPLASSGFLNFPGALGFGTEEGADSPSLISLDEDFGETPQITALNPLSTPEGTWAGFRGEFHPIWEKLMVCGRWQSPSNGDDSNPQVLFSLWQQNISSTQDQTPLLGKGKQPYPNPIKAGEVLFLPSILIKTENHSAWILNSVQGRALFRWPHSPGLKTLTIGSDIPTGRYILKSPDPSIRPFQLIVE
jgi:hypothetical protein